MVAVLTFVYWCRALSVEPLFSLLFYMHSCFSTLSELWFYLFSLKWLRSIIVHILSFLSIPQLLQSSFCRTTFLAGRLPGASLSIINVNPLEVPLPLPLWCPWDCTSLGFFFWWFILELESQLYFTVPLLWLECSTFHLFFLSTSFSYDL